MRVVAGIVAMLLLAGCGPQQSLKELERSRLNHCEKIKDAIDVNSYKNKTYWVNKNSLFVLCDGFAASDMFCSWSNEIAQLKPGASFTVSDVWCDHSEGVNFQVVTDAGLAGWVHASSRPYKLDALEFHDLLDHPRKEKSVGGTIKIGMTKQQVIDSELGLPDDTTSWETKNHVTDKWKYGVPDSVTLFFEDGVLRMIKK